MYLKKIKKKFFILIKILFQFLGLEVKKINLVDLKIDKAKKINNPITREKYLRKLILQFKANLQLQKELLDCLKEQGSKLFQKEFENYKKIFYLRNEIKKLSLLNIEFITPGIITGSIGNYFALENLIEAKKLNLRPQKKIVVLLKSHEKPRNKTLFKYFKEYLTIIEDEDSINSYKELSEQAEIPIGYGLDFNNKKFLHLDHAANFIEQKKYEKKYFQPTLKLTEEDYVKGKKLLKQFNVSENSWYVTLHVRELGYRGETEKNTTDNFRNATVQNYIKAVKKINEMGGIVFRMGDASMTKMPKLDNCIDYVHHKLKSDFMDVFLAATSKFCLGTASGYVRIPRYFGVPVILADCSWLSPYFSLKSKDLFIPRPIKDLSNNKLVNFKKLLSLPYLYLNSDKAFKKNNFSVIANTEDEIFETTSEMIEKVFTKDEEKSETFLQKKFKLLTEKSVFESLGEKQNTYANIGASFIKKYEYLLSD